MSSLAPCVLGGVAALAGLILLVLVSGGIVYEACVNQAASAGRSEERPDLPNPIRRMAVADRAGIVVLRTGDDRLSGRELRTGAFLDVPGFRTSRVTAVAQSADGRVLAVGYLDGSVHFRTQDETGPRLKTCERKGTGSRPMCSTPRETGPASVPVPLLSWTAAGHSRSVNDLCLSRDGRVAVSSSGDGSVIVWEVRTGEPVHRLSMAHHVEYSTSVATVSQGGELIASANGDSIYCWQTGDGRLRTQFAFPGATALAFSPDAERLLVASLHACLVHCLDASSGREQWAYPDPRALVGYSRVVASPDGQTLAAGSIDGEIHILALDSGELLKRVPAHAGPVSALQYSQDGRLLFSASQDGTLAAWETAGFTEVRERIRTGPYTYATDTGAPAR